MIRLRGRICTQYTYYDTERNKPDFSEEQFLYDLTNDKFDLFGQDS